jgi:hypothetical protein
MVAVFGDILAVTGGRSREAVTNGHALPARAKARIRSPRDGGAQVRTGARRERGRETLPDCALEAGRSASST